MAVLPDYVTGLITLANGSATVTGTGTMFATAAFKAGDTLQIQNLTAVIASVDSNTQVTLAEPWTGTSLVDAPYRARYLPDGARVTAQTTTLIEILGNGVLSNIASIPVQDGNLLVGNASGQYEPISKGALGIQDPNGSLGKLAALTLTPQQILQTDDEGALKQVALSPGALLGTDANSNIVGISQSVLTQSDFFRGFAYSPNASAPTSRLDIAAGMCRDATNAFTINLANPITKNVTAAFAVGNGNGALDTGTISIGFFSIHAISNPTTGAADVLVSLSMNNPVMPAGFTARRWIGGFCYAGGIIDFVATGDWHYYKTRIASVSAAPNGTTPQYRLLAVPLGAKCQVQAYLQSYDSTATNPGWLIVRDPDAGSFTVSSAVADWFYETGKFIITRSFIRTDNVGRVITADTNVNGALTIAVEGWCIDRSVYR